MQIQIKPGYIDGQICGCRAEDAEHFGVYTLAGDNYTWFADFRIRAEAEAYAEKLAKQQGCSVILEEKK